ncbi:MAG: hypothetical protein AB7S36_04355 [Planctomycetota bacterium]
MSGTTNIGDINVRLRARYAFLLVLLIVDAATPLVMAVVLPNEIATEIRAWHLLGLLAIPVSVVLVIFAIMDRFRVARARVIRPKNKKVREAWWIARINLAMAMVVPLALITALVVKALPDDVRNKAFQMINVVMPGTTADNSAPGEGADNSPGRRGATDNNANAGSK